MFTKISWTQYLSGALVILIVYYLYVAIRYYLFDLKGFIQPRSKSIFDNNRSFAIPEKEESPDTSQEDRDDVYEQIEQLISELKNRIAQASKENLVHGELEKDLASIIHKYPDLKDTPYQEALNELMLSECEKYGLTALDGVDMDTLWLM